MRHGSGEISLDKRRGKPGRGVEGPRLHLDTDGRYVLLLELARDVTLDEGGLADTTVTDKQALKLGNLLLNSLARRRRGVRVRPLQTLLSTGRAWSTSIHPA